jgi:lysophospholipid hydrolase
MVENSVVVILTRFSRVTFNAAHRYLGLTTEVLRTEKAINDIACHPLPSRFYEGGGLQNLRQRFDDGGKDPEDTDAGYLTRIASSIVAPQSNSPFIPILPRSKLTDSPVSARSTLPKRGHLRGQTSRHMVQAGDLHTSETYGPISRMSNAPFISRLGENHYGSINAACLSNDDFDLREEIMSCIAKSIGLLQPPLSGGGSAQFSPAVLPSDPGSPSPNRGFGSSFGSLSLLDIGDDTSSVTGGSSTMSSGYMSWLDNEVEILFFAAGSTLARAGEQNTGE